MNRLLSVNVWALVGTLLLGGGAGYAIGQGTVGDPEAVERVVEVEKIVERTPQACLDALDVAGEGFTLGAAAMDASADAMQAIAALDVDGINAATARIEGLTAEVETVSEQLGPLADECRGGAA